MGSSSSLFRWVFLPGVILAFAIPAGVFLLCALLGGMSVADSVRATGAQFFAERYQLFGCGALGLLPVVVLTGIAWLLSRKADPVRARRVAQVGLAGIALVLIWVNAQFWPGYLPERTFRGFPHGLEFVIGPLFFAPAAMVIGMLAGWFATRDGGAGE